MALAIPGGAPGYDDDKQFGNFITHMAAHTSQRLRGYSRPTLEVKGGRHQTRFRQTNRVPGVRRGRICCFQPCAAVSVARMSVAKSGGGLTYVPGCRYAHPGYEALRPAIPSPPPASPIRIPAVDAGTR